MDWPSPFSSSIGHNAIQLRRIKRKKKAEHLCKNVRYILKLTRVKNRGWHVGTKIIFLIPNMVLAIFLLRVMFLGIYVIKESKKRGQCNSWVAICVGRTQYSLSGVTYIRFIIILRPGIAIIISKVTVQSSAHFNSTIDWKRAGLN